MLATVCTRLVGPPAAVGVSSAGTTLLTTPLVSSTLGGTEG